MAQIDGLGYMLEVLRRRISANARRPERTSSSRALNDTDVAASTPARANIAALREKVRERLGSLDREEVEHREKAVRIFLESVILWEFGDDIAPAPEFAEIVSNISSEMNSHPTLRTNLDRLVDDLLAK